MNAKGQAQSQTQSEGPGGDRKSSEGLFTLLQDPWRGIASEFCNRTGEPPLNVVTGLTAVVGHFLGGRGTCFWGSREFPLQFGLLLVSDKVARGHLLLSVLTRPLLLWQRKLWILREAEKVAELQRQVQASRLAGCSETLIAATEALIDERNASDRPVVAFDMCGPKEVQRALGRSFDRSITILDGGIGIDGALEGASMRELKSLSKAIGRGWDGIAPVGPDEQSGRFNILATVFKEALQTRAVQSVLLEAAAGFPVLLLSTQGARNSNWDLSTSKAYSNYQKAVFDALRLRAKGERIVYLADESGMDLLGHFDDRLSLQLESKGPSLKSLPLWFPELAFRIAATLTALRSDFEGKGKHIIPVETIEVVLTQIVKPLVNEHLRCLTQQIGMSAEPDPLTAMTDRELEIHQKIAMNPGCRPSKLPRLTHRLPARERDLAISSLLQKKLITFDRNGGLHLT